MSIPSIGLDVRTGYDVDRLKREDYRDFNNKKTDYLSGGVKPDDVMGDLLKCDKTVTMTPEFRNNLISGKKWYTYDQKQVNITKGRPPSLTREHRHQICYQLIDDAPPSVQSVSAPNGPFQFGDQIPLAVTFSEPVSGSTAQITVATGNENKVLKATEQDSAGNTLTFLYPVRVVANASGVKITEIKATDLFGHACTDKTERMAATTIDPSVHKPSALTPLTAEIPGPQYTQEMIVTADIDQNQKLTEWLANELAENRDEAAGVCFTSSLTVSVDGGQTKHPFTAPPEGELTRLTARIPLEQNTGNETVKRVAELYLGDDLVLGRYAVADQAPAKFITADDMEVSLSVKQADGSTDYEYADESHTIYLQDNPKIAASYQLKGDGFSFTGADQLVWSSSDETVAQIAADGSITPTGKAGEVYFTLTAKNGGAEGREVTVNTETLKLGVGLTPFLSIPNNQLRATDGQAVTVYWTSNLCDKNGSAETTFTVTVTGGMLTEPYKTTVTGTAENPAASCEIPGSVLKYDYTGASNNTYNIQVSSIYQGKEYPATATITLDSKPAIVTFDKLDSYYITDTQGPVNISWKIENFDRYTAHSGQFEMLITKGTKVIATVEDPGTGSDGTFTGSYLLDKIKMPDKSTDPDPTSYRDVYTVTIKAKNGADNTWSYDSFLLYVYDADALKIWVNGEDKDNITLSNVKRISDMEPQEILALKRDIPLKSMVSVNYGEYAWSELADQIKWASKKADGTSGSAIASVNYQQDTLYENIEHFTYTSYRPTTDFGLSGHSDGTVTISATHKLTGMNDSLKVTVETLKDRLYLFQLYPQAKTTLTYTNGNGEPKTAVSDETGAAAIYEESGIVGDVYCSSEKDGLTYVGTFPSAALETGEGDWTQLQRYPCNNMELRRAAYAYLYIKNPDGTPYEGMVNFRGGVYVNDEYKQGAMFALQNERDAKRPGNSTENNIKLGKDGKLTVTMDQTQCDLPGDALYAGDKVEYVFQISLCDNDEKPYRYIPSWSVWTPTPAKTPLWAAARPSSISARTTAGKSSRLSPCRRPAIPTTQYPAAYWTRPAMWDPTTACPSPLSALWSCGGARIWTA